MIDHIISNKIIATLSLIKSNPYVYKPTSSAEAVLEIVLTDYQKQVISSAFTNNDTLVLNGRQIGATTISLATALTAALDYSHQQVLFVTGNEMIRKHHCSKLQAALQKQKINFTFHANTGSFHIMNSGSNITICSYPTIKNFLLHSTNFNFIIAEEAMSCEDTSIFTTLHYKKAQNAHTLMLTGVMDNSNKQSFYDIWKNKKMDIVKFYIPSEKAPWSSFNRQEKIHQQGLATVEREFECKWN